MDYVEGGDLMIGAAIWGGLAVASATTLAARRPWTEALARKRQPAEVRALPIFRETNLVITGAWTAYFALAAAVSAVSPGWMSWALSIPTPLLGELSHRAGPRYAAWRLTRGADI
jgi:hypothetical protein